LTNQLGFHSTASQGYLLAAVSEVSAAIAALVLVLAVTSFPLTAKGVAARDHLLGVREYIRVAEASRIEFSQGVDGEALGDPTIVGGRRGTQVAKLDNPLLPYAVLFNQERGWRRTLDLWAEGKTPTGWWSPVPVATTDESDD
jgi:hypothetical protein